MTRRAVLLCLALATSISLGAGQDFRTPSAQRSARVREQLPQYLELVKQYRAGRGNAVDVLLQWKLDDVDGVLQELTLMLQNRELPWDARDVEAAAMLHTDGAWRSLEQKNLRAVSFQLDAAGRLLAVSGMSGDDFAGRWYETVAHQLRSEDLWGVANHLLALGRKRLPQDPRVLYESGIGAELMEPADPRAAETSLRRAMAAGRTDDLVRLHLGRVLLLEHKDDDALTILDDVFGRSTDPAIAYLAARFGGAIHERHGRLDAAARQYSNAGLKFPAALSAYIASTQALQRQARTADAQLVLRKLLSSPAAGTTTHEPYFWYAWYAFGPSRPVGQATDDLRADARTGGALPLRPVRDRLPQYHELVGRYRAGRDDAVDALLGWKRVDIDELLPQLPDASVDPRWVAHDVEGAAMLHTDAAFRLFGEQDLDAMFIQLDAATRILAAGGSGANAFASRWYEAVAQWLRFENRLEDAERVLSLGRQRLPNDSRVLYESGVTAEMMAAPAAGADGRSSSGPSDLTTAEACLREAIAAGYTDNIVRLHLGRVLLLEHRDDDAVAILDDLYARSSDPAVAYLAALFGGAMHERHGRLDTAADHYTDAIQKFSEAQMAYVALSEVRQRQGRPAEAKRTLLTLLGDRAASNRREPFWSYGLSSWPSVKQRMDDLRAEVR